MELLYNLVVFIRISISISLSMNLFLDSFNQFDPLPCSNLSSLRKIEATPPIEFPI